jgi:hypothetical protein
MLPSLLETLQLITSEKKIDFIIFSGDIVYSGEKAANFEAANSAFIAPLCKASGVMWYARIMVLAVTNKRWKYHNTSLR